MTRRSDWDHFPRPIEYLVLFAIVLVIALIIVEEIAVIYHWKHQWIVYLIFAGFSFEEGITCSLP